jgi:hypothetical protein
MKSKAAAVWMVVSLVLGIALVIQWNHGSKQQLKLEKLQLQVEKSASAQNAASRVQELEKERLKLIGELRAAEFELNSVRMAAAAAQNTNAPLAARASATGPQATPGDGAGGMGKMLGSMLKDPEMRKAMAQQQRMGMEMLYGSLLKELQLTPEQEQKFKDLLLDQQMENMEQAGAMFEGTAEDRARVAQELADKRKDHEAAIKELLGEDGFAQYEEYNQTLGERMMLEQFGRGVETSPEQTEQLLAIMRDEKRNVQMNLGTPTPNPGQDWQSVLASDDVTQKIFAQQEEVNARVLERAAQVLTPEQLQKFGPVLQNQLEMQKAGLKMARQMFGGENKEAPAAQQQ